MASNKRQIVALIAFDVNANVLAIWFTKTDSRVRKYQKPKEHLLMEKGEICAIYIYNLMSVRKSGADDMELLHTQISEVCIS